MTINFDIQPIVTAYSVALGLAQDGRPTDEALLEAAMAVEPPLLPPGLMAALAVKLDPRRRQAGRPRKGSEGQAVADYLAGLERTDIPPAFVCALIERLRRGKRFTDSDLAGSVTQTGKDYRDPFMRWIVPQLTAMIEDIGQATLLKHPDFHEPFDIDVVRSANENAFTVAQAMLRRFELNPPSIRRMRNIMSAKPTSKNVKAPPQSMP